MSLATPGTPGSVRFWEVGVEKLIWQLQRSVQYLHSVNHALRQRHLGPPVHGLCGLRGSAKYLRPGPGLPH